jgi:glutamyl-tRNA reductase
MEIANLVISHKRASVEEIQKAWHGDYRSLIEQVLSNPGIKECAVLNTCNRVELYVVGTQCKEFLYSFAKRMNVCERIIEIHENSKCLEHLLRVASGLESMMVGEDQILGQVKEFYCLAKEMGGVGEILDIVFKKAINVGKKVRNRTSINKGAVSIGSAAVQLAENRLGSFKDKKVLIVGAGEMGTLVARALAHKNADVILVANRTFERAKFLANKIDGIAVPFEELGKYMVGCDVVISATAAPHPVITKSLVEGVMKLRNQPLYLIDIAFPRDIEEGVEDIDDVVVVTIDGLREISRKNLERRLKEAKKAEAIIAEELNHLSQLLKEREVNDLISRIYGSAETIKDHEIVELFHKLKARYGVDEEVLPVLEDFASSLIKKLFHRPTVVLRNAARNESKDLIKAVEKLFVTGETHDVSEKKDEEVKTGENQAVNS